MNAPITLYHNPRCSNSRKVLAMLHAAGVQPQVVEYLSVPFSGSQLTQWLAAMGMSARDLMRSKEALYETLDLGNAQWTEPDLIGFMVAHPVLVNRPIVVAPLGVRLCRPPERVLELLPQPVGAQTSGGGDAAAPSA